MAMVAEHPTKFTFPTLFSKFYGSGLPRPYRYFPDDPTKARVDPPAPVNGALLEWAAEAHWNMGGVNVNRTKLQGKIEGKLDKLDKVGAIEFRTHPTVSVVNFITFDDSMQVLEVWLIACTG